MNQLTLNSIWGTTGASTPMGSRYIKLGCRDEHESAGARRQDALTGVVEPSDLARSEWDTVTFRYVEVLEAAVSHPRGEANTAGKTPEEHVPIVSNTYPIRAELKALGGWWWWPAQRAWMVPGGQG